MIKDCSSLKLDKSKKFIMGKSVFIMFSNLHKIVKVFLKGFEVTKQARNRLKSKLKILIGLCLNKIVTPTNIFLRT